MNFIPAGAESDDDELPDLIAEQFGHHGWNINNVMNLYDVLDLENDLDLVDFGDDDDFFDDDEEDWYDEYYDSDFDYDHDDDEEEVESQRKFVTGIFKTLEDSTPVLSKLTFHRESSKDAGSRLPRILAGQTETYETLHKLLEEIEFLLKVWKNRVNHPFTAHLERKNQDGGDKDHPESCVDKNLVLGTDYCESDVESDITDHRFTFKSRTNVNMTLTRKKYCQSTKMYYNIFASEHEFEVLQGQIKAMRKHVFNITFNLFLQNVPSEQLPNELWEKIWKMALKNVEPDMPPTHTSGVREKASRQWTLFENERITDVFGAAGNLHMILFEVLFKHPYIMSTPKMIEMKTVGNLGNLRYFRYYFNKFVRLLSMKFSRLELLDQGIPKLNDSSSNASSLPLAKRIEKGQIHLTKNVVMKAQNKPFLVKATKKPSELLAVLYENEEHKVIASIWNATTNTVQCQINTGFSTAELSLQMNQFFSSSDESKFNKFSLTDRGFSAALTSDDNQSIEFYKWNFENQSRKGLIIDADMSKTEAKYSYVLIEKTNADQEWHMLKVDIYGQSSQLIIIDSLLDQPQVLKRLTLTSPQLQFAKLMDYKDDFLFLLCSSDDSVYNTADKNFILYDIETGKSIEKYHMRDFCELTGQPCCENETDSQQSSHNMCQYEAKFDLVANQFLICNPYMAGFILYQFDGKTKQTRILSKGSMFSITSKKMILLNGILFVSYHKEMEMLPMTPDCISFNTCDTFVEILAADLINKQVEPIISLGPTSLTNSRLLLNEMHRGIHFDDSNYEGILHPISQDVLVLVANYNHVVKLDISKSPAIIALDEAADMYANQLKKEEKLRKAEEAKKNAEARKNKRKEKEERIFKKLTNSRVNGPLYQWRGTYGFMKAKGEAKALGNLFVHLSNFRIPPEAKMRKNVWLECTIVKDAGHSKYKAVDIVPISMPEQLNQSSAKNQQNRRRGGGFSGANSSRRGRPKA